MKYLGLLAIIFLLPSVLAVSVNLSDSYMQTETVVAEIQGNILQPIVKEDITLWRKNVQVAFNYDFKKLGPKYYVWFVTPSISNNYTLKINDIETTVNGQQTIVDVETNFTVGNQTAPYYVTPAIVQTNDTFELAIFSNRDDFQDIPLGAPYSRTIVLSPGENDLELESDLLLPGTNRISFGYLSLLVYADKEFPDGPFFNTVSRVTPSRVDRVLVIGQPYTFPVRIVNTGSKEVKDIKITFNEKVFSVTSFPTKLAANKSFEFNVTLKQRNASIEELIVLELGNETLNIPVDVVYTINSTTSSQTLNTSSSQSGYFCQELNGKICQGQEVCQADTLAARDGTCCLGVCALPEPSRAYSWIGYAIGGILVIALGFVWFRYSKTKNNTKSTSPLLPKKI